MSVLRQNEQHEQIETMANHNQLCKGIENDKGNSVKWCVSKVPQYNTIGITHVFPCINLCQVPRKLFEHETVTPNISRGTKQVLMQWNKRVTVILAY